MDIADFLNSKTFQIITPVAGTLLAGAISSVLGYRAALSQRSDYARQIHVIELALKRNEYWTEYLKTSELANGSESEIHQKVKTEVSIALSRVRDEVNAEMKRLSWNSQIIRSLRGEDHTLVQVKRSLGWLSMKALFVSAFVIWFLSIASLVASIWQRKPPSIYVQAFLYVMFALLPAIGASFSRLAQKERYPEPPSALLDRV
jgi:hypothetical protein